MNLRRIEKKKERMDKTSLRSLTKTDGLRFGATTPKPASKPVVFWLTSGSRLITLGESFPIPGTELGIALEILRKEYQIGELKLEGKKKTHAINSWKRVELEGRRHG
jgi:hypothetical protein